MVDRRGQGGSGDQEVPDFADQDGESEAADADERFGDSPGAEHVADAEFEAVLDDPEAGVVEVGEEEGTAADGDDQEFWNGVRAVLELWDEKFGGDRDGDGGGSGDDAHECGGEPAVDEDTEVGGGCEVAEDFCETAGGEDFGESSSCGNGEDGGADGFDATPSDAWYWGEAASWAESRHCEHGENSEEERDGRCAGCADDFQRCGVASDDLRGGCGHHQEDGKQDDEERGSEGGEWAALRVGWSSCIAWGDGELSGDDASEEGAGDGGDGDPHDHPPDEGGSCAGVQIFDCDDGSGMWGHYAMHDAQEREERQGEGEEGATGFTDEAVEDWEKQEEANGEPGA